MLPRLIGSVLLLIAATAAACAQAERVVHVYNWSDYVDPAVLAEFTEKTGIKVVYDTYDTNEILETKLLAGRSGYDVVVPSGPFLQRLIKAGVFLKLDKSRLPNLRNVWPEIAQHLATYDPGNAYAVDYMWGTTGLGIDVDKVRSRLGEGTPVLTGDRPNSWQLLLDPGNAAKLKDCGISVLDSPDDVFPSVLAALGLDPNTRSEADLRKAADALLAVRPNVRKFHSSEYINGLANGDLCVALGYSGDVLQAKRRAEEAGRGIKVAYGIPREGALMWFDSLAIPADAEHVGEAYAFIDFLLRPEVAARNTDFVSYASGNLPAQKLISPSILRDPGIYPDVGMSARLFTNSAYDDATQRIVTRLWTRVRTGR